MIVQKIEITAPVGSYESLMAAIQAGADSVYFGVGNLNMRAKSSVNFTLTDLRKITGICKKNHVNAYLTLNSVIYDDEVSGMKQIIDTAKKCKVDAIIASDQAVIQYCSSVAMEVHMSTQANISNLAAVKYWAQFADVMVTARELSLKQVKAITSAIKKEKITGPSGKPVRIEIFAHGALCMAISGKCYLSLDNYNASANRGECFQLCRRPYRVFDQDGEVELVVDNEYIMSPKDLKTISFLDKIIKAGVSVLKIEGRGRSPEYVKTVISCYREAVDAIGEGTYTKEKIDVWNERLKTVYNRGFWDGYYLGKKLGEWAVQHGSVATQTKEYVGKVTNYFSRIKVAEIKMESGELSVGDKIYIEGATTGVVEYIIPELRVDLKTTSKTIKGESFSVPIAELLRRNDKIYKIANKETLNPNT